MFFLRARAMALLALGSIPNYGQLNMWTSRGPTGGQVAILLDPQSPATLYATSGQTITFQSMDAAAHWHPLDTGSVRLLAVDPQNSATF